MGTVGNSILFPRETHLGASVGAGDSKRPRTPMTHDLEDLFSSKKKQNRGPFHFWSGLCSTLPALAANVPSAGKPYSPGKIQNSFLKGSQGWGMSCDHQLP